MNDSQYNKNQLELAVLREDTLIRLEWRKLTLCLSHFATFSHTKEILKSLIPWQNEEVQNSPSYYQKSTKELYFFLEKNSSLSLENFDLRSFEQELKLGSVLSPYGLYQISTVMKLSEELNHNNDFKLLEAPLLTSLIQNLKPIRGLFHKLLKSVNKDGEVLPQASPELYQAHKSLAHAKRRIVENLEQILKNTVVKNALQESTWMYKEGRYVLPIRTDKKNDVEGIARGVSQTGATVFIEPKILATEQAALEKAQVEIQVEEYKVLKNLSDECYQGRESILNSINVLTTIDEINARTQFAKAIQASFCEEEIDSRPRGNDNAKNKQTSKFYFEKARHPLLILENKPCVANHIELNSSQILVLSGPNAGGKTVVLKTVGILVLMAKTGLFLPCDKYKIQNYENVFVLLGDNQNREENLSTFSGHLNQIKKIMSLSNEKTLLLLDEGFVGTDPAIGVALARAVLEYFAQKKVTVLITTHFSQLKTLAGENPDFCNASMEFELKSLSPTYKLLNKIPGQSFALELCARMGIEKSVIDNARKYYGIEAQRMEHILQDMQQQKILLDEELEKQKQITQNLHNQFTKLEHQHKNIQEINDTLVESYRIKLVKRFNAFSNRLDIRERQFERELQKNLAQSAAIQTLAVEEHNKLQESLNKKEASKEKPFSNDNTQSKKILTGLEQLSQIKLNNNSPKLKHTLLEPENFRRPRQMTNRSLVDEANESLELLTKSYQSIQKDMSQQLGSTLKIKIENPLRKAENIKIRPPEYWRAGMIVKSQQFREKGTVIKPADKKGLVECQFGFIKTKLHYSTLLEVIK